MLKFILVVGIMTANGLDKETPEVVHHDTMEECVAAGEAHFADRPELEGAFFMCGTTTTFQDIQ